MNVRHCCEQTNKQYCLYSDEDGLDRWTPCVSNYCVKSFAYFSIIVICKVMLAIPVVKNLIHKLYINYILGL